ncbi:SGNH/GDSL hydrolase family protein [Sinomonas sp. B1-1]|uniref:SGNH/GDSL hydrolase family protein n=1 Tax=Sinomonas sp. B1-1 TaxID=3141454 RepID=UPI003D2E22C7
MSTPVRTAHPVARVLTALFAAAGLVAGVGALPASAAPPQPSWYYALGDSYAAGVGGDEPVLDGTDCGRTYDSYPALLGAKKNISCGSATTEDVLKQAKTIPPNTGLISVTVGGNDVGAIQTTTACLNGSPMCGQMIADSTLAAASVLPGKLDGVIAAIRARTPNAQIVMTGYPHLFEAQNLAGDPTLQQLAVALNYGADVLNQSIEAAAARNGVPFVSVTGAFTGHAWPSADPWIHSPLDPGVGLHPNDAGYLLGYAPLVGAALGLPVPAPAG